MDWNGLSRLIPELGVLAVVGYFAIKALIIFKGILDKIDEKNHKALIKLSKSIDKNTEVSKKNIELTQQSINLGKEQQAFMKNLNGKLTTGVRQIIKENSNG